MPKTMTKRKYGPSDTARQARETDRERAEQEKAAKKSKGKSTYNPLEGRDDGILVKKIKERRRKETEY